MEPKFEVQLKIQKPVDEVYEAVVNPQKLGSYFVQEASGRLVAGTTVRWRFAEVEGEHPVKVREATPNQRIVLAWEASEGGYDTTVEMLFVSLADRATMVKIRESGWRNTPEGIGSSYDNCGGWMHMLCCLKAFIEHGINLRAGGAL